MHPIYDDGLKLLPSLQLVRVSTPVLCTFKPGPEMIPTRDLAEAPGKKAAEKIMGDDNVIHAPLNVVPVMPGEVLVIPPI